MSKRAIHFDDTRLVDYLVDTDFDDWSADAKVVGFYA